MPESLVGTSGFASPAFRGQLDVDRYGAEDLLASYSRRFSAIEMDSAFYRRPAPETVDAWARSTGGRVTFSVRIPREVTHVARLRDGAALRNAVRPLTRLGSRLACVLFTTPPGLECEVDLVQAALDGLPDGVRSAWEFRHASWVCPQVLDLLVDHGSAPVVVETLDGTASGELLPGGSLAAALKLPFVYVRLRKERYRVPELVSWGRTLAEAMNGGSDVFAFFRQCAEAGSYATALGELLAEAKERPAASPARNDQMPPPMPRNGQTLHRVQDVRTGGAGRLELAANRGPGTAHPANP